VRGYASRPAPACSGDRPRRLVVLDRPPRGHYRSFTPSPPPPRAADTLPVFSVPQFASIPPSSSRLVPPHPIRLSASHPRHVPLPRRQVVMSSPVSPPAAHSEPTPCPLCLPYEHHADPSRLPANGPPSTTSSPASTPSTCTSAPTTSASRRVSRDFGRIQPLYGDVVFLLVLLSGDRERSCSCLSAPRASPPVRCVSFRAIAFRRKLLGASR
jgi:hypothetical protein